MGTRHPHCRRLHLSKEQRRAQAGSRAGRDAGLRAPARPPSAAARGPATPTSTPTPPPTPTSTPTSTRRPTRPRPGARCPGGTPGLQEGRPGAAGVSGGRTGFPTLDTEKLLPAARPDSGRRSPTSSRSRSPRDGGSASERDRRGADGACSAARGGRRDSGGDPGSGSEKNSGGSETGPPSPRRGPLEPPEPHRRTPPQPEQREWWEGRACFLCRMPKGVLVFVWLGFCFFSSSALSSAGRGVEGLSLSRRQTSSTSSF